MITIVLCETHSDVLHVINYPHSTISEAIASNEIDRLHNVIKTKTGNTYFLIREPNHLLTIEAHDWTMTDACRFRKDLETFIKLAVSRCRLRMDFK